MFMRPSLLLAGSLASLASLAMGCSGVVGPDGADAEAASSTAAAVVVVSRTAGPGETLRDDAVVARFVRVRQGALDDAALRMAGVANELPALGQCAAAGEDKAALPARGIDLVDVGPLSLDPQNAGRSTVLLPRSMPDPTGIVSGVFYSARTPEAFTPGARVQLRASGAYGLPEGFVANVVAPHDLGDVRVTASADGLGLSWDAADDVETRDLVYVDVLEKSARLVTRCTTSDVGHFVVPPQEVASLDEGQVVVHRVHNESFTAKGIQPGEVRFDLARVVTFRR